MEQGMTAVAFLVWVAAVVYFARGK